MGKKQQIFQQFVKPRVQSLNTAVLLFFHFRLCAERRCWPLGYAAARKSSSAAAELASQRNGVSQNTWRTILARFRKAGSGLDCG